ncbi:AAA family ATPase [Tenacibaculum finnmarkense genomovar finnmarkense]|uniref:AAA family ATPase n=1 Tax=Tenacibaculum finnmarkense TaxID=2781243 RepID=UPI001E3FF9EE|nr:AAA family ATPase [Tenacibaculum finnmarkense]MCD8416372.1 AAA family ATPase [Tenacibaculum finnmarkense genomovar finnmarkense]MCG8185032.1 AAA family ATPase [Tenacibaculum finnmarkense genomovar finnmarkense]MCG8201134.1 AAA family ATPase [Tenacibaculum finnmarkense genomovar finnmarkense]MCG8208991.1 AAA family ATPase [Tenacibaculum finnmarkense genomovar finnmarkense]MCG8211694.1 AAA family ATPase [Tenacibaculum finnmarkense genomovar finnmarkense]
MKISKLKIAQYKHLENLDFDFTYQSGKRKGEPLDKICFIGQSATGKTNLLELLFSNTKQALNQEVIGNMLFSENDLEKKLNGELIINFKKEIYKIKNGITTYKGQEFLSQNGGGTINELIPYSHKSNLLFFKANIISDENIEVFTENPINLIEKYTNITNDDADKLINVFDNNVPKELWLSLIEDILDYRKKFTQKMSELIHKGLLGNPTKLQAEFSKWQQENPNKLMDFADKFNPLLEKLNLEVDLVNTEYSIPIINKRNEEIIPIQHTSTGTKGLLLSFLPLFKLNTKDAIILMDEPERSLYPDMQMSLMENYQNLAPDAQFIVATHSPFIAASFEPEERFILYFDTDGKVAVKRGSSPIGDDPNDMLKNDFGINYYNKHGQNAYKKYLNLKQAIVIEKDPENKKKLLFEFMKLGDTYNF